MGRELAAVRNRPAVRSRLWEERPRGGCGPRQKSSQRTPSFTECTQVSSREEAIALRAKHANASAYNTVEVQNHQREAPINLLSVLCVRWLAAAIHPAHPDSRTVNQNTSTCPEHPWALRAVVKAMALSKLTRWLRPSHEPRSEPAPEINIFAGKCAHAEGIQQLKRLKCLSHRHFEMRVIRSTSVGSYARERRQIDGGNPIEHDGRGPLPGHAREPPPQRHHWQPSVARCVVHRQAWRLGQMQDIGGDHTRQPGVAAIGHVQPVRRQHLRRG